MIHPAKQAILEAMEIDIWWPKEGLLPAQSTQPASVSEPPVRAAALYDTLLLLRECQQAQAIWIFADQKEWKTMALEVKKTLRTLLQCTRLTRQNIAPALLTVSGESECLEEALADQVEALRPEVLIVHSPLHDSVNYMGLPCCALPAPEAIHTEPEARRQAYKALATAGLLTD